MGSRIQLYMYMDYTRIKPVISRTAGGKIKVMRLITYVCNTATDTPLDILACHFLVSGHSHSEGIKLYITRYTCKSIFKSVKKKIKLGTHVT